MSRGLAALLAVVALTGCATVPSSTSVPWSDCARTEALALISKGINPSSPSVSELPVGESMEIIHLGPNPPDAIHDAFVHTLHLARSQNAFYVHRTGGIAGVNSIYGPVSLRGRCPAPASSAP